MFYTVDAQDTFTEFGAAWDEHAQADGRAELSGASMIGKSLWDIFSADGTKEFYQNAITQVRRTGAPFATSTACSTANELRRCNMTFRLAEAEAVRCEMSEVLRVRKPYHPFLETAPSQAQTLFPLCTFCERVEVEPNTWVPLLAAENVLPSGASRAAPNASLCPQCAKMRGILVEAAELGVGGGMPKPPLYARVPW
ncbi:MAG: hypothetical protein AAGA70_07225 [Pseudomonadota bacterium]